MLKNLKDFIINLLQDSGFDGKELKFGFVEGNLDSTDASLWLAYKNKAKSQYESIVSLTLSSLLNSIDWLQGFYLNDNISDIQDENRD